MNYTTLYKTFIHKKFFSIYEIKEVEPTFCMANLSNWQQKGYIRSFIKGRYYFLDATISETDLYHISNQIYNPSYISLETALQIYNIIPEAVPNTTCISSKKTTTLQTKLGNFIYRKIKNNLFFGYKLKKTPNSEKKLPEPYEKDFFIKIATIEKTIIDYIYLNTNLKTKEDFYELRWNIDEILSQRNKKKFITYSNEIKNNSFHHRINTFISFIKSNDRYYDY